jgi:hypothetical protein
MITERHILPEKKYTAYRYKEGHVKLQRQEHAPQEGLLHPPRESVSLSDACLRWRRLGPAPDRGSVSAKRHTHGAPARPPPGERTASPRGPAGTLCENLDTLDESDAKASMVWIVGEYAERIDTSFHHPSRTLPNPP